MSIDPRIMKQLLQLQLSTSLNMSDPSASDAAADSASPFYELLQSLLGGQPGLQQTGAGQPDTGFSALSSLSPDLLPSLGMIPAAVSGKSLPQASPALPPSLSKPTSYDPIVADASHKYGVDSALIKGVIDVESSFNPYAQSGAGAKGLMQLMDGTAEGLGVTDSFDPEQNIHGGTQFLADLLNKYNGNTGVSLAAYNAGPGRIDKLGIKTDADLKAKLASLPVETQKYVGRVMEKMRSYQV